MKVLRKAGSGPDDRFLLQGLYVTSRRDVVVDGTGIAIAVAGEGAMDDSPPVKGNLLPNGSFEIGMGRGWGLAGGPREGRDYTIASLWDATGGYHGKACVNLPPSGSLISRLVHVRPGRKHALSVWARPAGEGASLELRLFNANALPKEIGQVASLSRRFRLTPGWQRLELAGDLTALPAPEYHIRVTTGEVGVSVDALQLEEGDASDYRPAEPVQVGLVSDRPSNVFQAGQPVAMRLRPFNGSPAEKPWRRCRTRCTTSSTAW